MTEKQFIFYKEQAYIFIPSGVKMIKENLPPIAKVRFKTYLMKLSNLYAHKRAQAAHGRASQKYAEECRAEIP